MKECVRNIGGIKLSREYHNTRGSICPSVTFTPQIPLQARRWSRLSVLEGSRLIVWCKALPFRFWVFKFYILLALLCASVKTVLCKIRDFLVLTSTVLLVYFNFISNMYCLPTCMIECYFAFVVHYTTMCVAAPLRGNYQAEKKCINSWYASPTSELKLV
jgi:hypothetical protein